MHAPLEFQPGSDSLLHRFDPRWKLAALGLAVGAVALLRTLPASITALAGAVLLAMLARVPLRWFLSRLKSLAPFLVLFVLPLPFLVPDPAPLELFGPITLSMKGTRLALVLSSKALAIVTLMVILLTTAPLHAIVQAAHSLRLPGLLIHLVLLAYRYVILLAGELARLRIALRIRGFRQRASLHSYRTLAHLAGTLLVRGQERAERVSQAMRSRGFDGRYRSLTMFRTTGSDVVLFLLIIGGAIGLWTWDFVLR